MDWDERLLLGPLQPTNGSDALAEMKQMEHARRRNQVMHIADALLERISDQADGDGDADLLSALTDSFWNLAQGAQALLSLDGD